MRSSRSFVFAVQSLGAREEEQPIPDDRPARERADALLAEGRGFGEVIRLAVGERTGKRRTVQACVTEESIRRTNTVASGINSRGEIVGYFTGSDFRVHGFVLADGHFTILDVPEAGNTFASGVNIRGQIVGDFVEVGGPTHGFVTAKHGDVPGSGRER